MFFLEIVDGADFGSLCPMRHGLVAKFAHLLHHQTLHFLGGTPRGVALASGRQPEDGFKLRQQFGVVFDLCEKLLNALLRNGRGRSGGVW